MAEKIYYKDSYAKEFDATVVSASGRELELDRTAFYPGGGGQLCDTGTVSWHDGEAKVLETRKAEGDRIIHALDSDTPLQPGDAVHGRIDWDRRYGLMRHHTALHVIDAIAVRKYSGRITGNQIYPDRARMDLDVPDLDRQKAQEMIGEAQAAIDRSLNVTVRVLPMDEADRILDLARTKPGQELMKRLKEARVVDIEGLDMQLDGGTHVANTREIGRMELTGYESRGTHNKRVEIRLV